MRHASVVLLSTLFLLTAAFRSLAGQDETIIILVRHAERIDDGLSSSERAANPELTRDPSLSDAGGDRSTLLAEMLRSVGLTQIHSTDYARTRETAGPTLEATGLGLAIYDPDALGAFAETLRSTPGRHLIVGHSNTTFDLVEALGGDPGSPIEPLEYDRLYILTIEGAGVRTVLLRFGEPFHTESRLEPGLAG